MLSILAITSGIIALLLLIVRIYYYNLIGRHNKVRQRAWQIKTHFPVQVLFPVTIKYYDDAVTTKAKKRANAVLYTFFIFFLVSCLLFYLSGYSYKLY